MCKIFIRKNCDNKLAPRKVDIKKALTKILVNYQDKSQFPMEKLSLLDKCNESKDVQIIACRKEKSRLAAKQRREQENELLTWLYRAMPVSENSKLLAVDSDSFIGNFEKSTIIKVAAYILKLYNELPRELFNRCDECAKFSTVSVFSQSIFGLIWCRQTAKLVFMSPGLAKLTGLYWCNMIGMPKQGIIVDSGDNRKEVFLRLMVNATKDRGIFTVNPFRNSICQEALKLPNIQTNCKDVLGQIPCSIWCNIDLTESLQFNLIQPLQCPTSLYPMKSQSKLSQQEHIVINYSDMELPHEINSFDQYQFTSYHHTKLLTTIDIDDHIEKCIGITKDSIIQHTNLYSLFHLEDLSQISLHLTQMKSSEYNRICTGMARIITGQLGSYRWCYYIMKLSSSTQISVSNISHYRSVVNQGEAYSDNLIQKLFKNKDHSDSYQGDNNTNGIVPVCQNAARFNTIQITFQLCHKSPFEPAAKSRTALSVSSYDKSAENNWETWTSGRSATYRDLAHNDNMFNNRDM